MNSLRYEEISVEKCTNCRSRRLKLDRRRAEIYCEKCGEIVSEKLIDFDPNRSLAENIKYVPKSKKLIIRYPSRFETLKERALKQAHSALQSIDSLLDIPRYAKGQVLRNYIALYNKGFTFGRDRTAILGALIYIVSRNNDLFYYLDYISDATEVSTKLLRKFTSLICSVLKIKLKEVSSENYLIKLGNELNLSQKVMTISREILEEIKEKRILEGRSPITLTALSLYYSAGLCKEQCTFDIIQKKIGVYPSTMKQVMKSIDGKLDLSKIKGILKWV